jgi:hypothetical protein
MSQNPSNVTPGTAGKHYDIMKILAIALGLAGMLIIPISLYAIGQLLAVHMAFSDLNSGFSQAAFYQVVYNATHVSQYSQMAELNQGEAVNVASQDESTISLVMMGFGLLADIPLALKLREWVSEL